MLEKLTAESRKVFQSARQSARASKSPAIDIPHILLGIIALRRGDAYNALKKTIDIAEFEQKIKKQILIIGKKRSPRVISFSPEVKRVLDRIGLKAYVDDWNFITPEHIFIELLEDKDSPVALEDMGVSRHKVRKVFLKHLEKRPKSKIV